MSRRNVTATVDAETHQKLRVRLLKGDFAQKDFGAWLRAQEEKAVKEKVKR